jgi:hypothetical protein
MAALLHAAREHPVVRAELLGVNPLGNRATRLLCHFELHGPSGLPLNDRDPPLHAACRQEIRDPKS